MPTLRPIAITLASLLLVSPLLRCGGDVVVDADDVTGAPPASADAGMPDASGDAPDDASDAEDDAGPIAPPQCHCPGSPGYAPCVKPMECCPVVGVCKDPASFNCTGSSKPCP